MPMREELPCRAQSPPANRTKFIALVGVLALIILIVLACSMIEPGLLSSTFTIEEQWLLGP
jgi:hypothetical protein